MQLVLEKAINTPEIPGDGARSWDAATPPLQQALGRGFRWLRQLDAGEFASMSDIARHEGTDPSYILRTLSLTLLAPNVIKAILDDTLRHHIRMNDLAINPPMLWDEQLRQAIPLLTYMYGN